MVLPESWDSEQASITTMNGMLMVRQTESGQRKVRQLLVKLGAVPAIRYHIRRPRYQPPLPRRRAPRSKPVTTKEPTTKKPTTKKPTAKKPVEKAKR